MAGPPLDAILNLARLHRAHERFYARAPLEGALGLHGASRAITTLADRWSEPAAPAPTAPVYSAAELIDHAADSAALVHDNERRWRVFLARVAALEEAGRP